MGGDGYSPAAALSPGLEKPDEQRTSPTSIPATPGAASGREDYMSCTDRRNNRVNSQ